MVPHVGAIQPTGPITIEIEGQGSQDPMVFEAVLNVTANVKVENAVLSVQTGREVESGQQDIQLQLGLREPQRVPLSLKAAQPGQFRIEFHIKAKAQGFDEGGAVERRYLVTDGKNPARLLTGKQLRREFRIDVDKRLRGSQAQSPEGGVTLDTLLRGKLKAIERDPAQDGKLTPQPLAPPSSGIEPYEQGHVMDKTADVIRDLDPLTIIGQILYTDRGGALRPFVNATVDIRDSDTGPDEQLISVITGWDGRFSAMVNNDDGWFQNGRDIYIRIRTTNSRFRVEDCSYLPDWTYAWESDVRDDLSDGTVVDFGSLSLVSYDEAAILFIDLNQGWNFLTSSGGQDPGFVDLCFPEDASVYSTFWEEIDIEDGDEVARDIVLHEYGHATMHNAYDGYWPSNTGGSHSFDDMLHPNMAFTEGWGTFIALAINPDGVYHSNGWSRGIESFSHISGHSADDGKTNEGHVAAGMNDVRDTASDGGCTSGDCDPSGANATPFATIWRDAFWRSNADNIDDHWDRLCGELSSAQRPDAIKALTFNDIDVSSCVCTVNLAFAGQTNASTVIPAVRQFRDRGLRSSPMGRRIIETYYRHTAEIAKQVVSDDSLRQSAIHLFSRVAEVESLLRRDAQDEILLDAETAKIAREFIARLRQAASDELRAALDLVEPLVGDFEGLPARAVRAKLLHHQVK
jgi:hypothetical protein